MTECQFVICSHVPILKLLLNKIPEFCLDQYRFRFAIGTFLTEIRNVTQPFTYFHSCVVGVFDPLVIK